jgi:hypothetical protein
VTGSAADRSFLLWALPALAAVVPLVALLGLLLGMGPLLLLWRVCMVFLLVSPITGLLGLRSLARVGDAAPAPLRRTARTWCYLTFVVPVVVYLALGSLVGEPRG